MSTNSHTIVATIVDNELLAALDEWRLARFDKPDRAKAIRELVKWAFEFNKASRDGHVVLSYPMEELK